MTRWFSLLVLVVGVLGCRQETLGRASVEKGETASEGPAFVVGFTSSGDAAVFDGRTGAITSSAAGGGGTARDVAVDPWRRGVWVFEENEDGSGGEIRFCPLEKEFGGADDSAPKLGECAHAAWVDGLAALFAAREGLWVFEDGVAGPRWKVLREGFVAVGIHAPRPASLWTEGERTNVLSYGFHDDRLLKHSAVFGEFAPVVTDEFDWGEPLGYPPTTRYVSQSDDAGLLFDANGGDVVVRRVMGKHVGPPTMLGVAGQVDRIEAAAMVGACALVLGTDTLWIVAVDDGGVENVASVWLDGDVRRSLMFLSRDLAVTTNRAFVATNRGVRAIGLEKGAATAFGIHDERFVGTELRGPLDIIQGM